MANKKYIVELDVETGEFDNKLSESKDALEGVGDTANSVGDDLSELGSIADNISGGLLSMGRGGLSSIRGLTKGFKGLRAAIISTGIGALIVAVASLITYFKNTEKGAKALQTVLTTFEVIFGKIQEALVPLGEWLVKVFTEPRQALDDLAESLRPVFDFLQDINTLVVGQVVKNFKQMGVVIQFIRRELNELLGDTEAANEANAKMIELQGDINAINEAQAESWNDIKEAVSDVGEAFVDTFNTIVEEVNEAIDIADRYATSVQNTRNLIQKLTVDNAKLNGEIEIQQKIIDDTTRSYNERSEALDKQNIATEKLAENIAMQARAEEDLLRQQISITDNYEEREELETQLADKVAERIDAETRLQIVRLENEQKTREIDLEEFERKKSINQMLEELRIENIEGEFEAEQARLKQAEKAALTELDLLRATEEEKALAREYYANLRAEAAQAEADRLDDIEDAKNDELLKKERELMDSRIEMSGQALGAISGLVEAFGNDSAAGAKRQFNINKALGIAEAVVNTSRAITAQLAVPQDALTGANFVKAGIAAATGAAQIAKIASSKFEGGGSTSAPSVPSGAVQVSTTAPSIPQIQEPSVDQSPLRAFVIEKEVTNSQAQNQKINEQANLVL